MSQIKTLTDTNIENTISTDNKIVLLDFTAKWCGPCKMMNPLLEEILKENSENISIYKVDVDDSPEIAQQYGVKAMPTFVLMKNGSELKRRTGATNKSSMINWIVT